MGFESKCGNLNCQVIYTEKSKLNIADMRLIPLDRVTYHDLLMLLPQRRINSTEFLSLIHVSERNLNDKQICISKTLMCWSHRLALQNILKVIS